MNNSDKLRQTITSYKIGNIKAQKVEKDVLLATKQAIELFAQEHKDSTICWESELKKVDIHQKLKNRFDDSNIGSNLSFMNSSIKPDGGFIYLLSKNEQQFLLGAIEAKKQGTNDIRELEGKLKQSRGNAIERTCKNYIEIENYCFDEGIFPYLIFMKGCDLEDLNSSIRDRITNMNLGSPFNNLYVSKIADKFGKLHSRASIYIGIENIETMSQIILEMFNISYKYYIEKYFGEFENATQ